MNIMLESIYKQPLFPDSLNDSQPFLTSWLRRLVAPVSTLFQLWVSNAVSNHLGQSFQQCQSDQFTNSHYKPLISNTNWLQDAIFQPNNLLKTYSIVVVVKMKGIVKTFPLQALVFKFFSMLKKNIYTFILNQNKRKLLFLEYHITLQPNSNLWC